MSSLLIRIIFFGASIILGIMILISKNNFFSIDPSYWGSLGDFLAGTIGILFAFLSVRYMYLTFREQRKSKTEIEFQQYVTNYYSLLSLIHENWLHKKVPEYQNGREIFGNAVLAINIYHRIDLPIEKRVGNFEFAFRSIYQKHINVFEHYCAYIQDLFRFIFDNKELSSIKKEQILLRFLTTISIYEFLFFSYYNIYISTDINKLKIRGLLIKRALMLEKVVVNDDHQEQKDFIIDELKKHSR